MVRKKNRAIRPMLRRSAAILEWWSDTHGQDRKMMLHSQHDEREREPCDEVDAECTPELCCVVVGGRDAKVGEVEGGERQPESAVRGEGCKANGRSVIRTQSLAAERNGRNNLAGEMNLDRRSIKKWGCA